jgi:DinB superfamily
MRTFAITLLFTAASSVWGADASMSTEERAHVLKLLEDSRAEFLSYIENVSEAQWTWKAAPRRWSVGETAEHILLSEGALFGLMQRALASPPNPEWEKKTAGKTEFIERVMVDRSHKATAPEPIRPQGLSKEEVIRRYKEARAQTVAFARDTQIALKEHTSEHPFPVFNTLNAYQWLLYIPLHNLRHDRQIAEVKASPGYPK